MEKLLYSMKDAAAMLSISRTALHYLIVRGDVKPRRIGGRVLIHHKELERLASRDVIQNLVPAKKQDSKTATA